MIEIIRRKYKIDRKERLLASQSEQANRKREIIFYLTLEPPNGVELTGLIYLGLVIVTVSNSTNIAIVDFERVKVRTNFGISHCD